MPISAVIVSAHINEGRSGASAMVKGRRYVSPASEHQIRSTSSPGERVGQARILSHSKHGFIDLQPHSGELLKLEDPEPCPTQVNMCSEARYLFGPVKGQLWRRLDDL